MPSIKKNVGWSSILTTANYVFPLITYPYVSRVLGVANIGICNFVDSVIDYYCLFSMMGISYVAIREVANSKGDKNMLSQTCSSLLALNMITTIIVIFVLIASIFLVPRFHEHYNLLLIGVFKVLFNTLSLEWLYRGLEDFRYITVRSIIIRIVYVFSVFVFVREGNDYAIYYLLLTLTIVANSLVNLGHSRKYVRISLKGIRFTSIIKPFFILGVYQLLTSLYKTFNIVFLGFEGGNEQVGYYTTATKMHGIFLALFTAFTSVMMPRMTSLVAEGKRKEFDSLFKKSVLILFSFSAPLILLGVIFSDQIIHIIAGGGYDSASPCMQLVMPLVFIIGYEQILVYQILMPIKKDKSIFINSIIGAVVGLALNLILVPLLHSIGSSLVWLISELVVLISAQCFVNKYVNMSFPYKTALKYILIYIPLACILVLLHNWNPIKNDLTVFVAGLLTFMYFIVVEIAIQKNEFIVNYFSKLKSKINI